MITFTVGFDLYVCMWVVVNLKKLNEGGNNKRVGPVPGDKHVLQVFVQLFLFVLFYFG